jgi:hypothetical protein
LPEPVTAAVQLDVWLVRIEDGEQEAVTAVMADEVGGGVFPPPPPPQPINRLAEANPKETRTYPNRGMRASMSLAIAPAA